MTKHLFACLLATTVATVGCASSHDEAADHAHDLSDQAAADYSAAYLAKDELKGDWANCSGVVVPDRSGFDKRIALTFDDGPNPITTPQVMETLRKHGVPAAFFINGSRVRSDETEAIAKEIVDDPTFLLANHTWSHPNMARLDADAAALQIDKTIVTIQQAGGEAKWFRFPFGSATCELSQMVRDRNAIVTGWHIDSADWCYAPNGKCAASTFQHVPDAMREDMQGFVMQQARAQNGGILLFHDIHQSTADALEGIILQLEAEGFTFVQIDDVETFPRLNGFEPPFIGDVCASDADCEFSVDATPYCHLSGFCTVGCEGYCPDAAGKAPTFCAADPFAETPGGICMSQAHESNNQCKDLAHTLEASADRYIGGSSASARQSVVCMPESTRAPQEDVDDEQPVDPVE